MKIAKHRKRKRYLVGMLIGIGMICLGTASNIKAAGPIDVNQSCSFTVSVPEDSNYQKETNISDLQMNMYRIATVTESGKYVMEDAYVNKIADVSDLIARQDTDWVMEAQKASTQVANMEPTRQISIAPMEEKCVDLPTGMYLIVIQGTKGQKYEYAAKPYFISLPYNKETGQEEQWVYQLNSELKLGEKLLQTDTTTTDMIPAHKSMIPVKTGDHSNVVISSILLLFCGIGLVGALLYGRYKKNVGGF